MDFRHLATNSHCIRIATNCNWLDNTFQIMLLYNCIIFKSPAAPDIRGKNMEENIIGLIAEAEERAAAKKAQALSEAAEIVAAADSNAQEIARRSVAECAVLRDEMIKCAEEKAAADYDKAIEESRAEAKAYADSHFELASGLVFDIVGRLTK